MIRCLGLKKSFFFFIFDSMGISTTTLESFKTALEGLIEISDLEFQSFAKDCELRSFPKKSLLSEPGKVPHEVYFISEGLVRVMLVDTQGVEHTTHFTFARQFIADYSAFLQERPAAYTLQALEETKVIVIPRQVVEYGYQSLHEGQKLGRLVAEYYFNYLDERIQSLYLKSPKERYEHITEVFPDIHNRVPQHMIASYLGITSVHLSRLKRKRKP